MSGERGLIPTGVVEKLLENQYYFKRVKFFDNDYPGVELLKVIGRFNIGLPPSKTCEDFSEKNRLHGM